MSNDKNTELLTEEGEIRKSKDQKHFRKPIAKIMNITNFLHLQINHTSPKSLIKFQNYSPLPKDFNSPKKSFIIPIISSKKISYNSNQTSPKNIQKNIYGNKPRTPLNQCNEINRYTNIKDNNYDLKIKLSPGSTYKKIPKKITQNQTTPNLNKKNKKIKFTKKNIMNNQQTPAKNKNFENSYVESTKKSKDNNKNKGNKFSRIIGRDEKNDLTNKNMNDNSVSNYNYSNEMRKKKCLMKINNNSDLINKSQEINYNKNKSIEINENANDKIKHEKKKEKEQQDGKQYKMNFKLNSGFDATKEKNKEVTLNRNSNKIFFRKKNIVRLNKINNKVNNNINKKNNNKVHNNISKDISKNNNSISNSINNNNHNNNIIENNNNLQNSNKKNKDNLLIKNERTEKIKSIIQKIAKKILFSYLMEWESINFVDNILNSIPSHQIINDIITSGQTKLLEDDLITKGKSQVIFDDLISTSKCENLVDDVINSGQSNIIVDNILNASENKIIINNIKENIAEICNKNVVKNQNSKYKNQQNILNDYNNNNLISNPININIIDSKFTFKSSEILTESPNNINNFSKSQRETLFTNNSNENDEINSLRTVPNESNIKHNFHLEKCSNFSFGCINENNNIHKEDKKEHLLSQINNESKIIETNNNKNEKEENTDKHEISNCSNNSQEKKLFIDNNTDNCDSYLNNNCYMKNIYRNTFISKTFDTSIEKNNYLIFEKRDNTLSDNKYKVSKTFNNVKSNYIDFDSKYNYKENKA